ncbi:hypothetical protein V5R04_07170 [Jonesiaceae bacterium BS-20]|uniref:Uncharacterized protein n=1 Tax=Jonesiaceae bacterium BS-20 TaxID=3120821 RepID=A0AAU7E0G4_9MICO
MTRRILLGLLLAIFAPLVVIAPASAAPAQVVMAQPVTLLAMEPLRCSLGELSDIDRYYLGCKGAKPPVGEKNLLPAQRWRSGTDKLHFRTGDGIISDLATRIQRDMTTPMYLGLGNLAFSVATSITEAAIQFDLTKYFGVTIDKAVAKVSGAIFKSGIVSILAVAGVLALLFRAIRGRGMDWKYITRMVVTAGLVAAMMVGAGKSTGTTAGTYEPGLMSPGWLAQTVNTTVSALASAPAVALTIDTKSFTNDGTKQDSQALSCDAYTKILSQRYVDSAGGHTAMARSLESSVPLILSSMWEQTGLRAWIDAQYGTNNPYGDYMYCRLLEERAGISPAVQSGTAAAAARHVGGKLPEPNLQSAAWGTGDEMEPRDRSQVAWAACRVDAKGNWTVAGDWLKVDRAGIFGTGRGPITPDDCASWWNDSYYTKDGLKGIATSSKSNIDFSGKASDTVSDTLNAPEARDFLLSLHGGGSDAGGAIIMMGAYLFSSVMVLLVFGLLGLAIFLGKLLLGVLTFSFMFVALKDLLPGTGDSSALGKAAKIYIGTAFGVFGMVLVFSIIALFSGIMQQAFVFSFGAGTITAMLGTGISPLLSVYALHWIFKKVLKVPSPLSLGGAKAWGQAIGSGNVGNAVSGSGLGSRIGRQASFAATAATHRAVRGAARGSAGRTAARAGATVGPSTAATALVSAGIGAAAGTTAAAARQGTVGPASTGAGPTADKPARDDEGRSVGTPEGESPAVDTPEVTQGATDATEPVQTAADTTSAGETTTTPRERREAKAAEQAAAKKERAEAREKRKQTAEDAGVSTGEARVGEVIGAAAVLEAKVRANAKAKREEAVDRRGYGGGLAGDAREALSERMHQIKENFKAKPAKAAKKAVGLGLLTVATGGLAAPVIGAVIGAKEIGRARQARQGAVVHHRLRKAQAESVQKTAGEAKPDAKPTAAPDSPVAKPEGNPLGTPGRPTDAKPTKPVGEPSKRTGSTNQAGPAKPAPQPAGKKPASTGTGPTKPAPQRGGKKGTTTGTSPAKPAPQPAGKKGTAPVAGPGKSDSQPADKQGDVGKPTAPVKEPKKVDW